MGWTYDGGDWARIDNGQLQLKSVDGSWLYAGRPEHAESLSYVTRAADDPEVDKLVAYARANPAGLNAEQSAFLANPVLGFDSFGQGYRWGALNLFDGAFSDQQAGALLLTGGTSYLSDADRAAGAAFVERESAKAQAARNDEGGMLGLGEVFDMVALAAAAYFGGAALGAWGGAGEAAAASSLASADAMAGIGASAWAAPTAATVSPATWAAFGNTASTADLYAAATSSAINTSVADYAAAAVAGESVGAMSAFSAGLPLSSLSGAVASPGFFSGALDAVSSIAKGGKQAVDAVRLVNAATGQNTIVPKNAPVPAGWVIDRQWTPPAIMPGAAAQQEQAVNTAPNPIDTGIVAGEASIAPYLVLAASLFFAVAYFGK